MSGENSYSRYGSVGQSFSESDTYSIPIWCERDLLDQEDEVWWLLMDLERMYNND